MVYLRSALEEAKEQEKVTDTAFKKQSDEIKLKISEQNNIRMKMNRFMKIIHQKFTIERYSPFFGSVVQNPAKKIASHVGISFKQSISQVIDTTVQSPPLAEEEKAYFHLSMLLEICDKELMLLRSTLPQIEEKKEIQQKVKTR